MIIINYHETLPVFATMGQNPTLSPPRLLPESAHEFFLAHGRVPDAVPDPVDGGVGVVALGVVGGAARHEGGEARRARQARAEVRRPEVRGPPQALQAVR